MADSYPETDLGDKFNTSDHSLSNTTGCYEDIDLEPTCLKEASQIRAIDKGSVHRICSGQVVLTLATAVKELVENSIDAGATTVEVKLKDYGSESIEVTDNGSGVEVKDFEGLTLKHHTSKLQDFDDLVHVTSFGFRGEALSSLCALSNMVITTRHKSATVGTRLEFDLNGRIIARKSAPRQVGTTVHLQNIFYTLPVRHKEFQRNLKKEFAKLIHVLNAYCLISTRVRISCSNQTLKGSRSIIVSTNGNELLRDNIANVFSPKQLTSLLEFRQAEATEEICADFGLKAPPKIVNFRIEGFVSKCEHGQGRSSTDRQFVFINRRPCDHAKILKLVNEVYHTYNRHQNPFIALSIDIDKESVDVNVTPDKRQIFLEGENFLLATLKASLLQMFESMTSTYQVNNPLSRPSAVSRCSSSSSAQDRSLLQDVDSPSLSSSLFRLKRSFSSAFARSNSSDNPEIINLKSKSPLPCRKFNSLPISSDLSSLTCFFPKLSPKKATSSILPCPPKEQGDSKSHSLQVGEVLEGHINKDTFPHKDQKLSKSFLCDEDPVVDCEDMSHSCQVSADSSSQMANTFRLAGPSHSLSDNLASESYVCDNDDSHLLRQWTHAQPADMSVHQEHVPAKGVQHECLTSEQLNLCVVEDAAKSDGEFQVVKERVTDHTHKMEEDVFVTDLYLEGSDVIKRRELLVPFCLSSLRRKIHSQATGLDSGGQFCRNFRAKICPTDNKSAEDELQKEISKDMFHKMEIVGQFNLGFIITRLGRDLFIVDQHATDEKYNFEVLQRDTILQSQKLIIPQSLDLTAGSEMVLIDNLKVFKMNGFDFFIDPEAPPTQRVKLVSAPVSKNWSFGKDDIEELLFMLSDSPNVMCRPSRVRLMFASRACRKSVMIGTALNKSEMKRIVTHMGQIEQPWNCPHGRPTMRHLFNLDMLPS